MILTTEQLSAAAMVRLCPEALIRHLKGEKISYEIKRWDRGNYTLDLLTDGTCFAIQHYTRRDNLLRALRSLGLPTS